MKMVPCEHFLEEAKGASWKKGALHAQEKEAAGDARAADTARLTLPRSSTAARG